jgi:predicted HTH transcriptional regulator
MTYPNTTMEKISMDNPIRSMSKKQTTQALDLLPHHKITAYLKRIILSKNRDQAHKQLSKIKKENKINSLSWSRSRGIAWSRSTIIRLC